MGSCQFLGKSTARVALLAGAFVLGLEGRAAAQLMPGIDEYADAIVSLSQPRWVGQRTPWPVESQRPASDGPAVRSELRAIAIHAAPDVPEGAAMATLESVEAMHDLLVALGFDPPPPDGEAGGDGRFDVYLVHQARLYDAVSDGPLFARLLPLDSVVSHAVVNGDLPKARLAACAAEAYANASLLSLDPSEASAWRRATATYLAFLLTGSFDRCQDDVVARQQSPEREWVSFDRPDDAGGALLLAMLADRHGPTTFVTDLWSMARQRTWDGTELRGSPDLWEALHRALELAHVGFGRMMQDLAVDRFFAGDATRARFAPLPSLGALPSDAAIPVAFRLAIAELPKHTPVPASPLEPLGSAYALVDVRGAAAGTRLRTWLRGEYGVRWSLVVVGLAEDGRELGRVSAPLRDDEIRSYVPFEIDARVATVLVVVTNLSARTPDADVIDTNDRTFRLIFDVAHE